MPDKERVLSHSAAKAYYDRFGKKQDSQGFYENPALDDMVAHADFQNVRRVFEFGCGTAKFASRLLAGHLPASAKYLGYDISPIMIKLAQQRLEGYGERVQVVLSDGTVKFDLPEQSVDCVISCYVLDLLSETEIRKFLSEAHRVLLPGGQVCLASLTRGVSLASRLVSSTWMTLFRVKPAMVGGCRPIQLDIFVDPQDWQIQYRNIVTPYGVPSEVLILRKFD